MSDQQPTTTSDTDPDAPAPAPLSLDEVHRNLTAQVEQQRARLASARKTRDTVNAEIRRISAELKTAERVLKSFTPKQTAAAKRAAANASPGRARQAKPKA